LNNRSFTGCGKRYASVGNFLFGQYSIVDALVTPIVMRFNTCGVTFDGDAAENIYAVSNQPVVSASVIKVGRRFPPGKRGYLK